MGIDAFKVAQGTGLTVEEVQELAKEM